MQNISADSDTISGREAIMREIRKPGKVYVTMLIRDDVARIAVAKTDLLAFMEGEPADDCSVVAFRREDGSLVIDASH